MSVEPKHAKSIFLEALERSSVDRRPFLDERCAGDADLRRRVDALLHAHDASDTFLAEGKEQTNAEVPGEVIGRYKLLQQIGEGGFGTVWLAEQQRPVRRKVALKVIKLGMDSKQVVARFEAERQALALMDHPNIAKVLDGGATDSGRPYFVMELVRGVPITEYCDHTKLPLRRRLELFVEVCQAVQHAHQKGIIHRDIKPNNVLVTLHDGRPVPMVIDFGIAKATSGSLTDKTLFTEFRQFLGTPEYMSPEQAEMSGLDVDTRADVYSLGVLLYELLTGTTPFDPAKLRQAGYDEILRLICEVEPPRPSTRVSTLGDRSLTVAQARATEPGILQRIMSGDLDWIVMKALEKERTRRYESAAGLAADVRRHLANETVTARPPSRIYRMQKFIRRNRVGVLAGTLVVIALLVGTGAAALGLVQAREEATAARQINAFYDDMLLSIDPLRLRNRSGFSPAAQVEATSAGLDREVSVAEMLRGAAERIEARFEGKPELANKVRETIGVTLLGLGEPEDAARQLEHVHTQLREREGDDHPDVLRLRLLLGAATADSGDYKRGEELIRDAIAGMERVHGDRDARTLHARCLLGEVLVVRGNYEEARPLLEQTLAAQRKELGPDHRDTVDTLNQLAGLHAWQTRPEEGEAYAVEAHEIAVRTLRENDVVRAEAELALGRLLGFQFEYEEAEKLLRSALEKLGRLVGDRNMSTQIARHHLARCLRGETQQAERTDLLRKALAGAQALEKGSPLVDVVRHDLAMTLFLTKQTDKIDEAIRLFRENVASCKQKDPTSDRTGEALRCLRNALRSTGRSEELAAAQRDLVDYLEQTKGRASVYT